MVTNSGSEEIKGFLEVYVHGARDINNVCIYHKQDVYVKLSLTSSPANTVSTQIVNGGGKNPVFNEYLELKVVCIESTLKCEIWMLSKTKNYLENQLLGLALIPLSEILIGHGMLATEFSLSSTDMFHTPAGFVQLSLSYKGASPDVLPIPEPLVSLTAYKTWQDSEVPDSIPKEYDKIEFPDPQIVYENQQMVLEYLDIQPTILDIHSCENVGISDIDNNVSSDIGDLVVESSSIANILEYNTAPTYDTPSISVPITGSPLVSISVSSQPICDTPGASKSPNLELVLPLKEKNVNVEKTESSSGVPSKTFAQPVLKVNIPEHTVLKEEIVDMYMKSLQHFTVSIGNTKLPPDNENGKGNSLGKDNSSSGEKLQESKSTGSKVFYGSRAFF